MKYYIFFLGAVVLATGCSDNRASETKTMSSTVANTYSTASVEKGGIAQSIKLPGQLAAYEEVSIFPKVNGYVKEVRVDIGSAVSKGDLLMTLEAPEMEQATLQAKERYARSKADLSLDREKFSRLTEANMTQGAISPLDLSSIRSKVQADSAICNAELANWQMQQNILGYLKVTAPFNGVITERNVHPGTLVSASAKDKPMLELKQLSHLRLQIDVPENMSSSLQQNDTVSFYVSAWPGKRLTGTISRKSENINSQFRSERIEVDVPNPGGVLSAGMYADVQLSSKGNATALNVPKSAVVTSTERKYVLVKKGGVIRKVDITTGNTSKEKMEVFGALQPGDSVISNATDDIQESNR